jgi:hypothetical protein
LAKGLIATLLVVGSALQVRVATFVFPLVLPWLGFEVWWYWRHRGFIRSTTSAAGAA